MCLKLWLLSCLKAWSLLLLYKVMAHGYVLLYPGWVVKSCTCTIKKCSGGLLCPASDKCETQRLACFKAFSFIYRTQLRFFFFFRALQLLGKKTANEVNCLVLNQTQEQLWKQTNKQCCAVLTCEAALKWTWSLMSQPGRQCAWERKCVLLLQTTPEGVTAKGQTSLAQE